MPATAATFTAFAGHRRISTGPLEETVRKAKAWVDAAEGDEPLLFFEDHTGNPIDFDLHGTTRQAIERLRDHPLTQAKPAGPGRPRLGVVSREVSLLPRHWDWLEDQRGGISPTLRSLVEHAMKGDAQGNLARKAREAAGKFMWAMAGDFPGFEEASRALYAKDSARLAKLTRRWPEDVRSHLERLVAEATRLEELAAHERR